MDRQRLAAIDALLREALELEGEKRRELLEGADPGLRAEVERLLASMDEDDDHLMGAGARMMADALARAEPRPGDEVGAYTLEREIGRGGMSVVFLAHRSDGAFQKRVALKFVAGLGLSQQSVARFEQERQILARLSHPNVARLLDGGVDRRGRPYLVMEHVDGHTILDHCDRALLSVEERIGLMITAARTVSAAHRNLIVHRDLKPSNLMVDASGEVKLLDFGIAKLIDAEDAEPALTATHERAMTPEYASPEIVQGRAITTASDVYQLGLLLYEVVTGARAQNTPAGSLSELVRVVCELDPPRPSRALPEGAALADLARRRRTVPARLRRQLEGDFDAVIATALAKEPDRRYGSAEHFAADLERLLSGHPVSARRGTVLYRMRKAVRRHRAAAAALALTALMSVAYTVSLTVQAKVIAAERDRAAAEALKASEVERFVVGLFEVADPGRSRGRAVTARELVEAGARRIDQDLASEPEVQARLKSTLGVIYDSLGLYEEARQLHEEALALRRRTLGPDHLETAESLHRLGVILRREGDFEGAEPLLAEAEAVRRHHLPSDAPDLGESAVQRGYLDYYSGRYQSAADSFREALTIAEARDDLGEIARAEGGLAMVLSAQGKLDEAEERQRRALAVNRQVHGDIHPTVTSELFNLARTLQEKELYAEAQTLLEEVVAIDSQIYGDDHPEVGIGLSVLANNSQIIGQLDRADELFARAQEIFTHFLGPDHDRTLTNLGGIARLRIAQGRLDEAEELLNNVLERQIEQFGPDHIRVARILLPLGQCLRAQERTDGARAAFERALRIARASGEEALSSRLENEIARSEGAAQG